MSWIETSNGNRISKEANVFGSNRILLSGNTTVNPNVTLNAAVKLQDTGANESHIIQVGKYAFLEKGSVISPPVVSDGDEKLHGSIRIGSYSIIGEDSEISSVSIGNRVLIEKNCKIGNLSIIYDCCIVREGTVIPPRAVIPPFSEVSGTPGVDYEVRSLSNSYRKLIEVEARERYALG